MSNEEIKKFTPKEGQLPKVNFVNVSQKYETEMSAKKEFTVNDVLVEGVYRGRTEPNKYGKRDFKFKDMHTGETVIVNSIGNLESRMEKDEKKKIKVGDVVQLTYTGAKFITKGPQAGRLSHQFRVLLGD